MAKQRKPPTEYEIPEQVFVTTTRGVEVECMPIAAEIEQQEANIRASFTWPDCPQRTMVDVAGTQAKLDITPEWLATAEATEEQKAAYAEYKAKFDAVEGAFQETLGMARAKLLALRGVKVGQELLDQWAQDHLWMGMALPNNPRDLALHFFLTEIVGNAAQDMMTIMVGIYRASGYDPEVLEKIEASFRDSLGRAKGAGTDGNQASAGAEGQAAEAQGGELVGQSGVDGRGSRERTRAKAGRAN